MLIYKGTFLLLFQIRIHDLTIFRLGDKGLSIYLKAVLDLVCLIQTTFGLQSTYQDLSLILTSLETLSMPILRLQLKYSYEHFTQNEPFRDVQG